MSGTSTTDAKVIGLLGGMSWPSTITYYRELNKAVQASLGGSHSARVLIWSDDYEAVERMQLAGEWSAAGEWLADAALRLELAGADVIGIACNTMHRVAAAVRARTSVPLVDMIQATAATAADLGVKRAGILGTRITVEMAEYSSEFTQRAVELVLPSENDRVLLDHVIYDELCVGVVSEQARATIAGIISRLIDAGADGIVLACTELNLVVDDTTVTGDRVIDTAQVHVKALVGASLGHVVASRERAG